MQRLFVILINCAFLALLFIGVPDATRGDLIGIQVYRASLTRLLILWGLGFAAGGNALAALMLVKDKKVRRLAWEWAVVFVGLGGLEYALYRGCYNFQWLKNLLLWVQSHI